MYAANYEWHLKVWGCFSSVKVVRAMGHSIVHHCRMTFTWDQVQEINIHHDVYSKWCTVTILKHLCACVIKKSFNLFSLLFLWLLLLHSGLQQTGEGGSNCPTADDSAADHQADTHVSALRGSRSTCGEPAPCRHSRETTHRMAWELNRRPQCSEAAALMTTKQCCERNLHVLFFFFFVMVWMSGTCSVHPVLATARCCVCSHGCTPFGSTLLTARRNIRYSAL